MSKNDNIKAKVQRVIFRPSKHSTLTIICKFSSLSCTSRIMLIILKDLELILLNLLIIKYNIANICEKKENKTTNEEKCFCN